MQSSAESAPWARSETVTAALLLATFDPLFDGNSLDRDAAGLAVQMAELPQDQEAYVRITEEAFAEYLLNTTAPNSMSLQRTIDILTAMLSFDGRFELGLLKFSELAFQNPAFAEEATNAMAALANHHRCHETSVLPDEVLIERFERYMLNPDLFHNARECRNALWERASCTSRPCG